MMTPTFTLVFPNVCNELVIIPASNLGKSLLLGVIPGKSTILIHLAAHRGNNYRGCYPGLNEISCW